MAKIAIVYYSGYGHTKRLAEVIADVTRGTLHPIDKEGNLTEADWSALQAANVIIMGSPTYMGCVSWQFKKFAEATARIWSAQGWKDKLFAGFTNSATMNGDKLSTLHYLFTLAMQHSGLWVGTGLMPSNKLDSGRNDTNYVGSFGGLMATSPADASPDQMFPGDIETARAFGMRVMHLAQQLFR
jgi:NAD(P)H dehydrogenase (quinone)